MKKSEFSNMSFGQVADGLGLASILGLLVGWGNFYIVTLTAAIISLPAFGMGFWSKRTSEGRLAMLLAIPGICFLALATYFHFFPPNISPMGMF